MSKKLTLRVIAEGWKIYFVVRRITAAGLGQSGLVVWEGDTCGEACVPGRILGYFSSEAAASIFIRNIADEMTKDRDETGFPATLTIGASHAEVMQDLERRVIAAAKVANKKYFVACERARARSDRE